MSGPKVALAMIPLLLTEEFITCLLTSIQMFARQYQLQRLATNMLGLIVSLVLCNIKEADVNSELSDDDEDEDFSDDEENDSNNNNNKMKNLKPLTKREVLFGLYDEHNVLEVCKGVEDRIKLMAEYYTRKEDERNLRNLNKTEQSIGLIRAWHAREIWIQEHPDDED